MNCCVRGVAQLGSAPLWGSGGRGFKSRRSDLLTSNAYLLNISVVRIEDAVSCSPDVGDLRRRARNNGINPSHSTRSQLS